MRVWWFVWTLLWTQGAVAASEAAPPFLFEDPRHCAEFYAEFGRGVFPTRFTYLGEGARLWEAAVSHDAAHLSQEPEILLLRPWLSALSQQPPYKSGFNMIDIGPGSGDKAAALLGQIPGGLSSHYLGVDFSPDLAALASARIKAALPGVRAETHVADLENQAFRDRILALEKASGKPSVFFLLGQTMGNPRDIPGFLKHVRESMSPNSQLVTGIDLFDAAKISGLVTEYGRYVDLDMWIFRRLGIQSGVHGHHVVDFDPIHRNIRGTFIFDQAVTIATGQGSPPISFAPGQKLEFFRSHRFEESELRGLYAAAGLEITEIRVDPVTHYAVVIAKPKN